MQALSKLGELVDGRYRIVSQPPIVVPMRDLEAMYGISAEQFEHAIHEQFRAYRATLQDDRRHLLEKFQIIDMARKVVGVGSVGTRAFIVLLQGRDQNDPLFLQVKEATASVLEDHLPKSRYKQPGERVVNGQRLMQAASDIYLGWTKGEQAEPLPLLAPAPGHEGLRRRRVDDAGRARRSTRASADGRSPARTPAPETRSRSPPTWARATRSTRRSSTSPSATPTRTSATTRPSPTRSERAGWKRSKASDRAEHRIPNRDMHPGRAPGGVAMSPCRTRASAAETLPIRTPPIGKRGLSGLPLPIVAIGVVLFVEPNPWSAGWHRGR